MSTCLGQHLPKWSALFPTWLLGSLLQVVVTLVNLIGLDPTFFTLRIPDSRI